MITLAEAAQRVGLHRSNLLRAGLVLAV